MDDTPITTRFRSILKRRKNQLIEAEREIARLQERVINLQRENQLLSYRLSEAEQRCPNAT